MSKKSLPLSETQLKILFQDNSLYFQYLEALTKFLDIKDKIKNLTWDKEILDTLFPGKEGYEIVVGDNGKIYYCPLSVADLRAKISSKGLDKGRGKLTKREMIQLLSEHSLSTVDGKESHAIQIPKIGKS